MGLAELNIGWLNVKGAAEIVGLAVLSYGWLKGTGLAELTRQQF